MTIILSFVAASILVGFLFVVNFGLSHAWKWIIGAIAFIVSTLTYYGVFYLDPWLIVSIDIILLALISYICARRFAVGIFPINMRQLVNDVKEKTILNNEESQDSNYVDPLPLISQPQDDLQSFKDMEIEASDLKEDEENIFHIDPVQEEIEQMDLDQFVLKEEEDEQPSLEIEDQVISPLEELLSDEREEKKEEAIQFSEIEPLSFDEEEHVMKK